jgi:hypothetical protein
VQHGQTLALAVIGLQAIAVSIGFWKMARHWRAMRLPVPARWRFALFIAIFSASGIALSRDFSALLAEFAFATGVHLVNLATIVVAIYHLPSAALASLRQRWAALFDLLSNEVSGIRPQLDRVAVAGALWVALIASVLSYAVYQSHPHIPDEVCYLLQARYFASGRISLPAPPVSDAFDLFLMTNDNGRWYSSFPPGWPLVLAAGVLAGVPWLVNPLLAGICVLCSYKLLWHLYGRRRARLALLLLCFSPWFLFMSMNWTAHTSTLAFSLLGALAVQAAKAPGRGWWSVAAGAAAGMVSLIRPYDGFIVAGLLGVWSIVGSPLWRKARLALLFTVGTAAVGSTVFLYNGQLTGNALKFPVEEYFNRHFHHGANSIGFGPNRGMSWSIDPFPGHSPLDAAVNTMLNVFSMNTELLGWASGSLVLVAAALIAGKLQRRDAVMLVAFFVFPAAYALYWYSGGPDFGPRYWYVIVIPAVAISVRGLECLARTLESRLPDAGPRLISGVVVLCALTLLLYIPWRCEDKYRGYLRMAPDIQDLARRERFGRSLVFIRGEEHPDYASAATYNPLDINADKPIYVRERTPDVNQKVIETFRDRSVWVVAGPSVTGGRFAVASRPVADPKAQSLASR